MPRRVEKAFIADFVDKDSYEGGRGETGKYPENEIVSEKLEREIGGESPQHYDFAVGEGDESHNAHDDRIAYGHQRIDGALAYPVYHLR